MASPLTFDPSIVELFLALSNGGSVLMVTDAVKLAPRRLMDALLRNQVSVLQVGVGVPSAAVPAVSEVSSVLMRQ